MKKLPIGKQTFSNLIDDNCLYVDKTATIHRMITEGDVYFLSRPRRFGKSLLITTLKAIFEGRRDLFKGLAIDKTDYNWKPYPVLHLDFSSERLTTPEAVESFLISCVAEFCDEQGIKLVKRGYTAALRATFNAIGKQNKSIVVLIDEYDKPILDHIDNPSLAVEVREVPKGFYTTIKACDAHLRFTLLTGVSKFAKMSVFSGLNNLKDITLDHRFATMLGYTQTELENYFKDGIDALSTKEDLTRDACLEKIRLWYNGYCFSPDEERVYNPFSTLLLLDTLAFRNYWFETGTPAFLVKLLKKQALSSPVELEDVRVDESAFSCYDPERLQALPLLFQTGYLTILSHNRDDDLYQLGYPNQEVRRAFTTALLEAFSSTPNGLNARYTVNLRDALMSDDMDTFFETMQIFFANIPYDIQLKQEKYYRTIFYLVFTLLGMRIQTEVRTDRGRIDAVAETENTIFIFEFKLQGTAEQALKQIQTHAYALKYKASKKYIRLFGVTFDPKTRNIGDWKELKSRG